MVVFELAAKIGNQAGIIMEIGDEALSIKSLMKLRKRHGELCENRQVCLLGFADQELFWFHILIELAERLLLQRFLSIAQLVVAQPFRTGDGVPMPQERCRWRLCWACRPELGSFGPRVIGLSLRPWAVGGADPLHRSRSLFIPLHERMRL